MSTILKALKKLEQDKETLDAKGMRDISRIVATNTDDRPKKFAFSNRAMRRILIGAVFFVVLLAGGYFFAKKQEPPLHVPPTAETPTRKPKFKVTKPPKKPTPSARVDAPKSAEKTAKPNRKPAGQRPVEPGKSIAQRPDAQKEARVRPAFPKRDIEQERSSRQPVKTATAARPTPQAKPNPAKRPTRKPSSPATTDNSEDQGNFASAERLTGSQLKVQAIAWAPEAEQRMAVINSRIVREGSTVDSFLVVAIRQDDVIVKEQGQLYRVLFGKP